MRCTHYGSPHDRFMQKQMAKEVIKWKCEGIAWQQSVVIVTTSAGNHEKCQALSAVLVWGKQHQPIT